MKNQSNRNFQLAAVLGMLVAVATATTATGQATTGSIAGRVTVQADNSVLPGVTIEAIHVPTGTHYTAYTQTNGRFSMPNVRVGGPYTVTATISGFKPQRFDDVTVGLGDTRELAFELQLESVVENVQVTAEAMPLINPERIGSRSAVTHDQILLLPTVRRQIQDFARTNPYFANDAGDQSGTRLAVAGKNNRYNQIQIDGAVNNDLFGLADSGTPGGQADTQPISLDAIQELQLVVSPYDIKQGGFTGGGINAITRGGTNRFAGSVYGSKRDQKYVGKGPFDRKIEDFSEDQYGASLGGPILRDKLFFFASGEINRRKQPTGVAADGTGATNYRDPAQAAAFRDLLISKYGYDPGSLGDFSGKTDSDLFFGRFDYNLSDSHQATLRHNYVKAARDVIADRSSSAYRFSTAIYAIADKTNSTVFQLNSIFGSSAFNVGRIGYQTIRDVRTVPVTFPTVDIGPISRRPEVTAGTERFSGANSLDQDILEITDDLTLVKGDHTLTFGTHNEFFDFKNLYLPDYYGFYRFNTLADFEKGIAQEYSITFANGSDPKRPTSFGAEQYGIYAGDLWRVSDALTLTVGIRADYPRLTSKPSYNAGVYETFGINTSKMPGNMRSISPRVGFNWALGQNQQVRGGVGVFAGRTPYVWISNAFANTGIETTSLSAKNVTFNPDPFNQPKNFPPGTSAVSVDAIDPDFDFPRVLRTTLAYDRELPFGIRGTIEAMYTKTQQDVFYYNMNKVESGKRGFDGRPMYMNKSSAYRDIPYLSNTSKGEQTNLMIQLEKRFGFGLYVNGSYAYMRAISAFDGTSSRAISNWQYMPTRGDIYKQELSRTNWELRDRFNFVISETFSTGPFTHNIGLFYTIQSGQPYSILMGGDPNGDGYSSNDLINVPASTDDFILKGATVEDWKAFLSWTGLDQYRGHTPRRNSFFAPWNRVLDFHYDLTLPVKIVRTQVTFDILNLLNLLDQDKGGQYYVSNQTFTPINYSGIDKATGKPIYTVAFNNALRSGTAYSLNNLRSRWQLKLGLRLAF